MRYYICLFAFIVANLLTVKAEKFNQTGQTFLYQGRQSRIKTDIPVSITSKSGASTTNSQTGDFILRFNNAKPGDVISLSVYINSKEYVWFNYKDVQEWTLTSKKSIPIVLCEASKIENLTTKYSNNYVNWLKAQYEKVKKKLKSEIDDKELLNKQLHELEAKYKKDLEDLKLRSIEFAYVDESKLDTFEYALRQSEIAGDIDKAIEIGNQINFAGTLSNISSNLNKFHGRVIADANALYRVVRSVTGHIKNLEYNYEVTDTIKKLYDCVLPYYKQLLDLYSPTNFSGLRCSDDFYNKLKKEYADLLYSYYRNNYCSSDNDYCDSFGHFCRYLLESAEYDNKLALYLLSKDGYKIGHPLATVWPKKLIDLCEGEGKSSLWDDLNFGQETWCANLASIYEILERTQKYSFSSVIQGDSVCFVILPDRTVSLVNWKHLNKSNHKLRIPSKVKHEGKVYTVTKIGREALGCEYYGIGEEAFLEMFDDVESVSLPSTITYIASFALTGRFLEMKILDVPRNVRWINDSAMCLPDLADRKGIINCPKLEYLGQLFVSEDSIAAIYVPACLNEIRSFDDASKFTANSCGKFIVDKDNKKYSARGAALYSKNEDHIYLGSIWNLSGELYIPYNLSLTAKEINDFMASSYFFEFCFTNLNKIICDKNANGLNVRGNALYNFDEKSVLLSVGDSLYIPKGVDRISDAVLPVNKIIFSKDAERKDIVDILKATDVPDTLIIDNRIVQGKSFEEIADNILDSHPPFNGQDIELCARLYIEDNDLIGLTRLKLYCDSISNTLMLVDSIPLVSHIQNLCDNFEKQYSNCDAFFDKKNYDKAADESYSLTDNYEKNFGFGLYYDSMFIRALKMFSYCKFENDNFHEAARIPIQRFLSKVMQPFDKFSDDLKNLTKGLYWNVACAAYNTGDADFIEDNLSVFERALSLFDMDADYYDVMLGMYIYIGNEAKAKEFSSTMRNMFSDSELQDASFYKKYLEGDIDF